MPNINKIKLSGTSYDIQDSNATKTVTLTQAEYDALQTKDPNTFYIISDGETFDPSEKVDTSAFTAYSASVETALSGKAAQSDLNTLSGTVTGHTANTTIHVTTAQTASWDGAVSDISTISGDVASLSGGVATVSGAIPSTYVSSISKDFDQSWKRFVRFSTPSNFNYFILDNPKINGTPIHIFDGITSNFHNFSLVETSAITTSVTSSSTDSQVPSAKAVNDKLGGLSLVKLTQAEYDALATKDSNTLYVITNS